MATLAPSITSRPSVTFLSLALPPSIPRDKGQTLAPSVVQELAIALANQGWHVDLFAAAKSQASFSPTWLAPSCRLIPLPLAAESEQPNRTVYRSAPDIAQFIESFQIKTGLLSPLLHTFDPKAAEVGDYVKRQKGWRWIHTCDSSSKRFCDDAAVFTADQILLYDAAAEQKAQRWNESAIALADFYRKHLAAHVGATDIVLPRMVNLSTYDAVVTCQSA